MFAFHILEPSLSLGKQQGNLSSAMRSSVPRSGPIGQKELHAKVTERLQEVLLEQNQAPALQELTRPQRKKADVREDSSDQRSSTFSDPKEPQSRGKTKSQAMVKAGAAPNKAPAKAIEMKTQQEKSKSNTVLSVKEKVRNLSFVFFKGFCAAPYYSHNFVIIRTMRRLQKN